MELFMLWSLTLFWLQKISDVKWRLNVHDAGPSSSVVSVSLTNKNTFLPDKNTKMFLCVQYVAGK